MLTSAVLQAINGISLAALLFLLASGFTLSFGLMRVVNMAHGAYYLVGGYIGLTLAEKTGSFALALAGGGAAVVVLGFLVDRFLLRRTGENHLAQVLLTVGVAFVIGDVALRTWGGDNLMVPTPMALKGSVVLPGELYYPRYRFVLLVFGVVVAAALWLLYKKTQLGAVVRAGVDDREQVNATGINVDRLFVIISAAASFLATPLVIPHANQHEAILAELGVLLLISAAGGDRVRLIVAAIGTHVVLWVGPVLEAQSAEASAWLLFATILGWLIVATYVARAGITANATLSDLALGGP